MVKKHQERATTSIKGDEGEYSLGVPMGGVNSTESPPSSLSSLEAWTGGGEYGGLRVALCAIAGGFIEFHRSC